MHWTYSHHQKVVEVSCWCTHATCHWCDVPGEVSMNTTWPSRPGLTAEARLHDASTKIVQKVVKSGVWWFYFWKDKNKSEKWPIVIWLCPLYAWQCPNSDFLSHIWSYCLMCLHMSLWFVYKFLSSSLWCCSTSYLALPTTVDSWYIIMNNND